MVIQSGASSHPYTQPDPIVIDDDDDDFGGSPLPATMPNTAPMNSAAVPSSTYVSTGPFASIQTNGPGAFVSAARGNDNQLVQATSAMNLHMETGAPSVSPALLGPTPMSAPTAGAQSPSSASASTDRQITSQTGLVYDTAMMLHRNIVDPDHPEAPIRIFKIFSLLKEKGCVARMHRIPCREAVKQEVELIHEGRLWDHAESTADWSREALQQESILTEQANSLYINEHTAFCARYSCGGAIELCDAIASGTIRNGFAIIRPPGHHAEPAQMMGFCVYNNVAVATRVIQNKYRDGPRPIKKVLILDWDVHHGNGTQRAFEEDPDVLYISLHRYQNGEFYPGGKYGDATSVGSGKGVGKSVNIPWSMTGMRDSDYLYAFQQVVMPIATEFAPDFVIISAGFDAAKGDHIGLNNVTPEGYAHMTYQLASLAAGRLAVILEGGYNPDAIAKSALAVTKVILNEPVPELTEYGKAPHWSAVDAVELVKYVHQKYWSSIVTTPSRANDAEGLDRIALPELIKMHRRNELVSRFGLYEVPLKHDLAMLYKDSVFCTQDTLQNRTLVLFLHDMGNLRTEPANVSRQSAQQEVAYVVDTSSRLVSWVKERGYALIDATSFDDSRLHKLVAYLWDNFISISAAQTVILVGAGNPCSAITDLIERREVQTKTLATVLVPTHDPLPRVTRSKPLRNWFFNTSLVIIPADHKHDNTAKKFGNVTRSAESRYIRVFASALPDMLRFIESKIAQNRRKHAATGSLL